GQLPPQSTSLSLPFFRWSVQLADTQVLLQKSSSMLLASSHSSPAAAFRTPSPHSASVQSASQFALCPLVSQASPAALLTTPSPHSAGVQSASQVAEAPASSHASPSSTTPFPHSGPTTTSTVTLCMAPGCV